MVLPPNVKNRPRCSPASSVVIVVGTVPRRAHHGTGWPRATKPRTARPKRPAAIETGRPRAAREGRKLIGVRREPSGEKRRLLLLLLLERGGGEESEILELLGLAEELQRQERVGRRRCSHWVGGGGGEVGDRRREGGVHGGTRKVRRARVAAGPWAVVLVGVGAGRVEGAHGCAGVFGRRRDGRRPVTVGERFFV